MNKLIKEMNLTDLKVYALSSISVFLNVGDFNAYLGAASGLVALGFTLSKWYYLVKSKGKDEK